MATFDPSRPFNDPTTSCCGRDAADCDCPESDEVEVTESKTEWLPCSKCGATTRHDDGLCHRDARSALADKDGFLHTPETPDFLVRKYGGPR